MRQALTQRQLAQQIGLSYPTVSRAFNGSPLVDERTRKRILAAAARLGYRKNLLARSLVLRKTHSLGVVINNSPHSFWAAVLEGLESRARELGYHVLLSHSGAGDSPVLEDDAIAFLLDRQVDGLILVPSWKRQDFRIFAELEKRGTPLLFLDSRLARVHAAFVGVDNIGGMKTVCRHLFGLGHRRIAFVAGPQGHWNSDHRLAGYREAMQEAGLRVAPEWLVRTEGFLAEHGQQAAQALLALRPRPTAVIAVNDPIAFGLEHALLAHGVRVPLEMALVGFSGETEGALLAVPLTTLASPMREMGLRAAENLITRIAGKQSEMISQELPCKLIVRASCGAGQGRNGHKPTRTHTRRTER